MAAANPEVAVVTVTYRSTDEIGPFLEAVRLARPRPTEVVVVDNLSDDSAATLRLAESLGARTVALDRNVGYGAAVNAGVATLPESVAYVAIMNPDVRVRPESLSRLVEALESNPRAASAGPKVLNDDGTVYPSARRIPSLRTGVGHAIFTRVWPSNPWSARYRQEGESPDLPRAVGWLSGSCLVVRRSSFREIEGFDDRYFMYFEDVDLGYRFGRAGWLNLYEPDAVVTHIGGKSTITARGEMLRTHHRSAYRFLSGKYRGWYLAPLRGVLHAGLNVRAWWLTRGMP